MSQLPPAGGRATRPPGPLARTVQADAKLPAWSGAEGECVLDPVTPGVLWLGGARGGSRVAGLAHVPPEAGPNGGDVACAPGNLAFRDTTLAQIERSYASQQSRHARPFGGVPPAGDRLAVPPRLDPNWVSPLDEAGGDPNKVRELTYNDVLQSSLRTSAAGGVYCSPPEKFGQRQLVMDLLTAPWSFPFCSRVLADCPSARKLYHRALSADFSFRLPGLGGRVLDKAGFFGLIFHQLLPALPDLSFNARFLTTTGLDDCCHVEVAVTGTHTGAPLALFGLPPLPPSGARVALPAEFLRIRLTGLTADAAAADALPGGPGQEAMGFPTGVWLQCGGDLPGF